MASATADPVSSRWPPFEAGALTIYDRFPELTGRLLQDHVWRTYSMSEGITMRFFGMAGVFGSCV